MKSPENGRLDVILASLVLESRSQLSKAIKNGQVKVNDKVITSPSFKVSLDDEIEYEKVEKEEPAVLKPLESVPLNYVYKDKEANSNQQGFA